MINILNKYDLTKDDFVSETEKVTIQLVDEFI